MSLSTTGRISGYHEQAREVRQQAQGEKPSAKVQELHAETLKPTEFLIFNNKNNYFKSIPVYTATSRPANEQVKAAVVSSDSNSIFKDTFVRTSNEHGVVNVFQKGKTLASSLSQPEGNKGSSDKQDRGGNNFFSAGKNLLDTRKEALEKGDVESINLIG